MKVQVWKNKWLMGWIILLCILMMTGTVLADRNKITELTGNVVVEENEVIQGDVQALAGNITIRGTVNGSVVATAGTIHIYGQVNGNVQALAGNIYVRDNGAVTGDTIAMAGKVYKDESAGIGGSIVEMARTRQYAYHSDGVSDVWVNPAFIWVGILWGYLTIFISWWAIGALLILFFKQQIVRVGEGIAERPLYYFFIGFAAYVLVPVAFLLLLVTVIGIPVAFALIPFVIVATIYGQLGVARIIGRWMVERFHWRWNTETAQTLLGSGTIFVIALVPILGWLFFFATACIGTGGVVIHRFGMQKKEA